jgi:hypothetical protein
VDISLDDLETLARAKALLEGGSLTTRFANAVGQPVEKMMTVLPASAIALVTAAVNGALETALDLAIRSVGTKSSASSDMAHKAAVAMTGAAGGAFGIAAIAWNCPHPPV